MLDPHGRIAFSRTYVAAADKGKLVIDPSHYAALPRGRDRAGGSDRLDLAFVARFPDLAPLVDGLKLRMKTLAPVHIRALLRACDRYGHEAFVAAATRAQTFRRFDASAVVRILEMAHPLPQGEPLSQLSGAGPAVLGEVEPASLDAYAHLDRDALAATLPTPTDEETHHGS